MNEQLGMMIRARPKLAGPWFAGFEHRDIRRIIGSPDASGALSVAQVCHALHLTIIDAATPNVALELQYGPIGQFARFNDPERVAHATRTATTALERGERYEAVAALCERMSYMRVAAASTLLAWSCSTDMPTLTEKTWRAYSWFAGMAGTEDGAKQAMGEKQDYRNYEAYERNINSFVGSVENPGFSAMEVSDWMRGFSISWLATKQGSRVA